VHAKVGVEFVKNVFLVDCLLLKNIKLKKKILSTTCWTYWNTRFVHSRCN